MTIYEVKLVIEVKNKMLKQISEDSMNMAIINAYYTEIFRRQNREKKLPPLKTFLLDYNKEIIEEDKEKNGLKMLEIAKSLHAMYGGETIVN